MHKLDKQKTAQIRQTLPPIIMRTTVIFTIAVILTCCQDKQVSRPDNSDMFYYLDKQTGDSCKFYGYRNIDTAVYYAKKYKKNILVVFSCWACLADPRYQWRTLAAYGDNNKIQSNFIIAWLPVDDKRIAQDTSQVVLWHGQTIRLRTIGLQNVHWQNETFNSSSQPLYCFADTLKRAYGKTLGPNWDKAVVADFINSGLKK